MPANRSLNVTVNFVGTEAADGSYSGAAAYVQTHCMPPMNGLVAANGDVNLQNLPGNPNFHWAIGMVFILNAVVTDRHGNNVPCTWATPLAQACALTGPGGGPATGMTVSQQSPTQLTIANDNNDRHKFPSADRTYSYKLGVMLPSVNNYFISLDPKIVNTGPTSPTGNVAG